MSPACSAPRLAGWSWPSSPTRLGSARSGWPASSRPPPPEGAGPGPGGRAAGGGGHRGHPDRPGPDGPDHHRPRPHPAGRLRRPDRRGRQALGRPVATHPVRRAVQRPWLASGPGGPLWAAVGDPARWPSARHLYRASGLCPAIYASAGRRHDGASSREGSVTLRRAVLSLGVDCGGWTPPPAPMPPPCGPAASRPG